MSSQRLTNTSSLLAPSLIDRPNLAPSLLHPEAALTGQYAMRPYPKPRLQWSWAGSKGAVPTPLRRSHVVLSVGCSSPRSVNHLARLATRQAQGGRRLARSPEEISLLPYHTVQTVLTLESPKKEARNLADASARLVFPKRGENVGSEGDHVSVPIINGAVLRGAFSLLKYVWHETSQLKEQSPLKHSRRSQLATWRFFMTGQRCNDDT